MKSIILALTLVATNAFAGTLQFPVYGGISTENLCDAGSSFQTISPIDVCEKWASSVQTDDGNTFVNWTCVASSKAHKSVSKTAAECVKYASTGEDYNGTCVEYATVARPTTVAVQHINEEAGLVGFSNYTIPACASSLQPKPAK
jgi:hypothetical protein